MAYSIDINGNYKQGGIKPIAKSNLSKTEFDSLLTKLSKTDAFSLKVSIEFQKESKKKVKGRIY